MARISEQTIEKVRSSSDIVEVIQGYVQIKQKGVLSTMRKLLHFQLILKSKYLNVLGVALVVELSIL